MVGSYLAGRTSLALLNQTWALNATFTNYLLGQQKLVFKQRRGNGPAPRSGDSAHRDRCAGGSRGGRAT
jgi:hypothetical protein